jgi:Protein of unknown function (DUF1579)
MSTRLVTIVCCVLALVIWALPLAAQQPPKPGPEHEMLKKFEGTWDATMNFGGMESKGTAKYKMALGGFWLLDEFTGEFGGGKFEGKGATGYDPIKKKYVTAWIDSMSPTLMVMEGNFDKEGKTYTETGEGPSPEGKLQKMKSVIEFKDDDNMVFTMYTVADGKDQEMFKITYKRKK